MTIFVLIPVHNRLNHTVKAIDSLRTQTCYAELQIVVIDDGSTDGTGNWLSAQKDIITLKGDGNLWWGGSIDLGLQYALPQCQNTDYILFINNDTWFDENFVNNLRMASQANHDAITGSVVHENDHEITLIAIGPIIDINRFCVWDKIKELDINEKRNPKPIYKVDALSGRGTLYPSIWFKKYGTMHPKLLPHYFSDYEIAMRFARNGANLIVTSQAQTFSLPIYGSETALGWLQTTFSIKSANNIIHKTIFYSLVGSPIQRIFMLPRALLIYLFRTFKRTYYYFIRKIVRND